MTRLLIRLIALAIVASLPIPLHAQKAAPLTEKISKSFKVGPSGTLDVANTSGDVVVTAGGTDTIALINEMRKGDQAGAAKIAGSLSKS